MSHSGDLFLKKASWRSIAKFRLAVICRGCWFWARKLSHTALPNDRTRALRWRAKCAVGRGYWPHREMGQMGRWASGDDGNGFDDDEPEQASEIAGVRYILLPKGA